MKILIKVIGKIRHLAFLFLCLSLTTGDTQAQVASVKIMNWNLLNWPNTASATADSTTRCPYYRTVVRYEEPDILVTEENTNTNSTTWFLNQVMNSNGHQYSQGTYIQGQDTNNGIFYKDSLFHFVSNVRITTALRDISQFTLFYIPTGDTLIIYAVHLKASSGASNEQQRAGEVDNLRSVTDQLPAGTDFIICGDFNIYGSYESAYQKLLQVTPGADGHFHDPLNMPGTWNDPAYSFYHTQSTRLNAIGGGSYGGMNDRFDMILISSAVEQATGIYYQPGSLTPVGNDGNHFDQSINYGMNTAVPANVADALYYASDHLPVYAWFDIGPTSGIEDTHAGNAQVRIYPNPVTSFARVHFQMTRPGRILFRLTDFTGKIVWQSEETFSSAGAQEFDFQIPASLHPGFYTVSLLSDKALINKKLIIAR